VDEVDLVALAVPEEVVHRLARADERDLDVVVPHQKLATRDLVALGLVPNVLKCRCACASGTHSSRSIGWNSPELLHAAGRDQVVQDRLVAGEALEAHHLLGQESSVVAELDVALRGNLASALVRRHRQRRIKKA
jgi:hypothetical protein